MPVTIDDYYDEVYYDGPDVEERYRPTEEELFAVEEAIGEAEAFVAYKQACREWEAKP